MLKYDIEIKWSYWSVKQANAAKVCLYKYVLKKGFKRFLVSLSLSGRCRLPALPSLLTTLNQPHALQQEFKWRELEEQRKAERLHKRLQQEQAYLLSLQHESKPQPGDKTKLPSDHSKPPQTSTLPPDRALTTTPQAQVLDSAASVARGAFESSRAIQTTASDSAKSQAAVPEKTDSDETCPSPLSNSPSPPQTETPADSEPPQAESLEPDRPAEPVSNPPQPIREVNLLLGPAYPAACSFQLLLACLHTASVTMMIRGGASSK